MQKMNGKARKNIMLEDLYFGLGETLKTADKEYLKQLADDAAAIKSMNWQIPVLDDVCDAIMRACGIDTGLRVENDNDLVKPVFMPVELPAEPGCEQRLVLLTIERNGRISLPSIATTEVFIGVVAGEHFIWENAPYWLDKWIENQIEANEWPVISIHQHPSTWNPD